MLLFTLIWKFVFELVHADRQVSGLEDGNTVKDHISYNVVLKRLEVSVTVS